MKIYCEPCKWSGQVTHVMYLGEGVRGIGQSRTCQCLQCDGKGYTESPEAQRLIELGNAVEKAVKEIEEEIDSVNASWKDGLTDLKFNEGELFGLQFALDRLEWYREQEEK